LEEPAASIIRVEEFVSLFCPIAGSVASQKTVILLFHTVFVTFIHGRNEET
jgi:hypothetical protein